MLSFGRGNECLLRVHSEDSSQNELPFAFRGYWLSWVRSSYVMKQIAILKKKKKSPVDTTMHSKATGRQKGGVLQPFFGPIEALFMIKVVIGISWELYLPMRITRQKAIFNWIRSTSRRLQSGRKRTLKEADRSRVYAKGHHATSFSTPAFTPNRSHET